MQRQSPLNRVMGYARVSTEEQAREGVSIDAQRARIEHYAALHELKMIDVVVDGATSGAVPFSTRPGGAQVLKAVEARELGAVVVHKLDRLGRCTLDVLSLVETLSATSVALHSISEKLDTESAIGRFVLRTLASLAEMERDQVRERTSFALRHKVERGEAVSRPPRGLRIVDGRLTLDPGSDGLEMVSRAREMRSRGMTYKAVAEALTREGFRPKRPGSGPVLAASTVRYMLLNPRYASVA